MSRLIKFAQFFYDEPVYISIDRPYTVTLQLYSTIYPDNRDPVPINLEFSEITNTQIIASSAGIWGTVLIESPTTTVEFSNDSGPFLTISNRTSYVFSRTKYHAVLRLTDYETLLTFGSGDYQEIYQPFVFKFESLEQSALENASMQVSFANVNQFFGDLIQTIPIRGRIVRLFLAFEADVLSQIASNGYLEDIDNLSWEEFFVRSFSMDAQTVQLDLGIIFDLFDIALPKRKFFENYCPFKFKSRMCGFGWSWGTNTLNSSYPEANADWCDKTYEGSNGCKAHNNAKRFGGFPMLD